MELRLTRQPPPAPRAFRSVRQEDRNDLAILLYAAFRGTVDDEGETFTEALFEIDRTFSGAYGRLLTDCSFVAERDQFLMSTSLIGISEPKGVPLVVFSMTRPDVQRHGWGQFLLQRSIDALVDRGHERLRLIVTDGNRAAQSLYASLGFEPMSPSTRTV